MRATSQRPLIQLSSLAIRQLDRLQLRGNRFMPGYQVGQRPSQRSKPAFEFQKHRKYVPGDDPRFVDWKASARSEHIYLKQGENPQEATLYLWLDCSASMGWGAPLKVQTALSLAAALCYLALTHGDRVLLTPFGDKPLAPLGPFKGKGQMPTLIRTLRNLNFSGGTGATTAIKAVKQQQAQPGGMSMIISDFLGTTTVDALLDAFPNPAWETTLLHVLHPAELTPTLHGDLRLEDSETGTLENYDITPEVIRQYQQHIKTWISTLELQCRQHKAYYLTIPADWQLDTQILPRLRAENIVRYRSDL